MTGLTDRSPSVARPRWPLLLWALQLIPSSLLLAAGVAGLSAGSPAVSGSRMVYFAAGTGLIWTLTTIGMLSWPAGRTWLVVNRLQWCLAAFTTLSCAALLDTALTLTGVVPTIAD